jgi:(p)ppGpp synthase/HD superfamily hydrolase
MPVPLPERSVAGKLTDTPGRHAAGFPLYSPLIERALRVAAQAHRDQTRKGAGVPYFTHPAAVAIILLRAGWSDEHTLAAAILHDVAEDTAVSLDDLARDFPPDVVTLVACLSETKCDAGGSPRPWEVRKQEHIAHLGNAPPAARAIALADKLHNLETMLQDLAAGAIRFDQFNAPPDRLIWYYEQITAAADDGTPELAPLATACRDALDRLRQTVAECPDAAIDHAAFEQPVSPQAADSTIGN